MYDIRQFKPTLYCLLFLSILGFSLAAEMPSLWFLGTAAVGLNLWLVRRGKFRPMPRLATNLITICALLLAIQQALNAGTAVVLMIGQFLMFLAIVKLWEQRGNRDYAQLLILSLLLMIAGAISTASIFFGLILLVFLLIALYCCLLFHLKVEADAAREAIAAAARKINLSVLRQDQRHLARSMRKITLMVSAFALAVAVLVFIFFPRGPGAGVLGPAPFAPSQSLAGFTDDVSFQNIARIQQNDAEVATVKLWHNGHAVRGGVPLLLRGMTLDTYTGKEGGWRWVRWPRRSSRDAGGNSSADYIDPAESELPNSIFDGTLTRDVPDRELGPRAVAPADQWVQRIQLRPTGSDVLFSMAGPYKITSLHPPLEYRFWNRDQVMRYRGARDRGPETLSYEVACSNRLGAVPPPPPSGTDPREGGVIAREIRDYALKPEVSGGEAKSPIGAQRYERFRQRPAGGAADSAEPDDADGQIAANIERHLRQNFAYTLDLTDTRRLEGRDPMVAFLYDFKKGHCEYFAGAMTLLCQSLGMKARLCCGFRCDEYNDVPGAGYYIVRQSHAHAWVEVFTKKGWQTFDPTSQLDSAEQAKHAGFWQNVRHVMDAVEYSYANAVILYSNDDRSNFVRTAEMALFRATFRPSRNIERMRRHGVEDLLASNGFWRASSGAIAGLMALTAGAVLVFIGRYMWERRRLRLRAARIGIDSLPVAERVRLARQLGFYDDLMTLLGRHALHRLPSQTQLEFSQSLLFLPADAYKTVGRLTELFYRVRFGHAELSPVRQRHVSAMLERLRQHLAQAKAPDGNRP